MPCNPCCCSLQTGTKLIAIFDVISNIIYLGSMIIVLVFLANVSTGYGEDELTANEKKWAIIFVILFGILRLLRIFLAMTLYIGAKNRNFVQCRTWLRVVLVLFVLSIIGFVRDSIVDFSGWVFSITLLELVYTTYIIVVVSSFIKELQTETFRGHGIIWGNGPSAQPHFAAGAPPVYYVSQARTAEIHPVYPMHQYANPTPVTDYPTKSPAATNMTSSQC